MEDLTGKQLGPYQVVASLGEGGMAAVYKAFQPGVWLDSQPVVDSNPNGNTRGANSNPMSLS